VAIYEIPTGTIDGTNATFTCSRLISDEMVFVDRVLQVPGTDYTASGTTLTFLSGAIPQLAASLLVYLGRAGTTVSGGPGGGTTTTGGTAPLDLWTPPLGGYIDSREPFSEVSIDTSAGGKEVRSTWWSAPRYRWRIVVETLRSDAGSRADWQTTWGHFARRFGQLVVFGLIDTSDSAVLTHPFGLGDGATTTFQLQRSVLTPGVTPAFWPSYADGFEPIWAPIVTGLSIYVDGTLALPLAMDPNEYSLSSSGLVTFAAAPAIGAVLTWTGNYAWPVRLDGVTTYRRIVGGMWATEISLVSVRR
jgi:hypothetical protein